MFGPRLFRSRWAALLWAGGVLWTAYDVARATAGADRSGGSPAASNAADTARVDATGMVADAKDLAVLAGAGNTD